MEESHGIMLVVTRLNFIGHGSPGGARSKLIFFTHGFFLLSGTLLTFQVFFCANPPQFLGALVFPSGPKPLSLLSCPVHWKPASGFHTVFTLLSSSFHVTARTLRYDSLALFPHPL